MGKEITERPRTPKRVDEQVIAFCKTLSPLAPVWVSVKPWKHAVQNDCFLNVPKYVQQHGGTMQVGWMIWEKRTLWLEAEFHSCLVAKDNKYIDITPKLDNDPTILFLPDPVRVFEFKMVPNRFYLTSPHPLVKELVDAHQEFSNYRCQFLENVAFGETKELSAEEDVIMRAVAKRKANLEGRVFREV